MEGQPVVEEDKLQFIGLKPDKLHEIRRRRMKSVCDR